MRTIPKLLAVFPIAFLTGCKATVQSPPNLGPPGKAQPAVRSLPGTTHTNFYVANGCGVERWAVKTLTDPAAALVNLSPQQTSIAALVRIAPPLAPTDRVGPIETQVFRLSGTLTVRKRESDGDYHLVLSDGQNTMVVESTEPSCASGSRVLHQMEAVRSALDARAKLRGAVTVTGVGFFDRLHGQTGTAKNGIELHPLTSIKFR